MPEQASTYLSPLAVWESIKYILSVMVRMERIVEWFNCAYIGTRGLGTAGRVIFHPGQLLSMGIVYLQSAGTGKYATTTGHLNFYLILLAVTYKLSHSEIKDD